MVVHPAAGNLTGTLLNGLLHHCPGLQDIPRAGIVHRLDKRHNGFDGDCQNSESSKSHCESVTNS